MAPFSRPGGVGFCVRARLRFWRWRAGRSPGRAACNPTGASSAQNPDTWSARADARRRSAAPRPSRGGAGRRSRPVRARDAARRPAGSASPATRPAAPGRGRNCVREDRLCYGRVVLVSVCSPPRLAAPPFQFETGRLFAAQERTATVPSARLLRRTHAGDPGRFELRAKDVPSPQTTIAYTSVPSRRSKAVLRPALHDALAFSSPHAFPRRRQSDRRR